MKNDRTQWLKNRNTGLGGSDSSVILGCNPWKSKLELYEEKVTGTVIEKDNLDLHWGKKLEPFIIEEYIEVTKRNVEAGLSEHENIRSVEYPWMTANLDGVVIDDIKGRGILECKTKSAFIYWDKDIPDYYFSQIQHYMVVTGFKYASFAVLDFGKKNLIIKDIERDEKFIKELIEKEKAFWDLVINKIPPSVDGTEACENFLKNKYNTEEIGKTIDLTGNEDASNWILRLKAVRNELKICKDEETECKNNLMNIIGNAEIATGEDYKITWKSSKDKEDFDIDKFKEENPDLYKKYASMKKQSRRFNVYFKDK